MPGPRTRSRRDGIERHILDALTPTLLVESGSRWGIAQESLRLVRDHENFVYGVEARGTPSVLRLTHCSHRSHDDLEAELDFVRFLADRLLPVCRPLPSARGEWVEAIGGGFFACCFERAAGLETDWRDPALWNERLFATWGRTLASFHLHAQEYRPPAGRPRRGRWAEDDINVACYLPPEDADVSARLTSLIQDLDNRPMGSGRYGLIHGDLHHGNFFTSPDGRIAVFDFDDSSYHWFAYDLAVAFCHLPADVPPEDRKAVMAAILAGYRRVRPLPDGFFEDVRLLLLLRDMQIYQALHKKTAPADRDDAWRARAARLAGRIRRGEPACVVPAGL